MKRAHIIVLQHGNQFDAYVAGLTHGVSGAASAEEAIGRLVMLLSHPLGITIERETAQGIEEG